MGHKSQNITIKLMAFGVEKANFLSTAIAHRGAFEKWPFVAHAQAGLSECACVCACARVQSDSIQFVGT